MSDSEDSVEAVDANAHKFDPHNPHEPMEARLRKILQYNSEIRGENKKLFQVNADGIQANKIAEKLSTLTPINQPWLKNRYPSPKKSPTSSPSRLPAAQSFADKRNSLPEVS